MSKNAAHIIVTRIHLEHPDGSVLLVRRSASCPTNPGKWEFAGGMLDDGESLEEGAIRETREETGIALDHIRYLRSFNGVHSRTGEPILFVFFFAQVQSSDVVLSDEHDDYAWVNAQTFRNYDTVDGYQSYLAHIFEVPQQAQEPSRGEQAAVDEGGVEHQRYDMLDVYTDGGSRGNPGPSASGYVIMTPEEVVIEEGGEYLGITTNNQAEYQAVKLALEQAKKFQPRELHFYIDSLLVVNQMNGVFKIKNRDLWPVHEAIRHLMKDYEKVTFTHVRREFNTLADGQVNQVLDARQKRPAKR